MFIDKNIFHKTKAVEQKSGIKVMSLVLESFLNMPKQVSSFGALSRYTIEVSAHLEKFMYPSKSHDCWNCNIVIFTYPILKYMEKTVETL